MLLSIFRRIRPHSRQTHSRRLYTTKTGPIIGIDLGTTNSCVAVLKEENVVVLENEGKRTTPSIFAIDKNGNRLVGAAAQRQMVVNPKNTFFATKRLIGRRFNDKEISELAKQVPFSIVPGPNGDAWVADDTGKKYSPEQIASNILLKLKQVAETYLGCDVHRAVITVPAYFDNHQRQATEAAGKIAGLHVERIINEPTAAALAYGISRDDNKLIAVYDLGGGTFDISILELGNGIFEVKSTAGDTFLGGEDFNSLLGNYLIKTFQKQENIDLTKDKVSLQRVREAAENAKHDLSARDSVKVNLPYIHVGTNGVPKNLEVTVTRALFENMAEDLIKKSIVPCKKALADAGLTVDDISDVILVGGMTRMPKVREYVKKFFKKEPFAGVNPDEAVAVGAALQGSIIENKGLIPGSGEREIILLDVTPLNLGTSVHSGEMVVIIPAQSTIPCTKSSTFTTHYDYQTQIQTQVYQGNRPIAKDNRLLGEYVVSGIPAAPAGIPKIDVTFTCSANGTITATSQDRATKVVQGITLSMAGGLSEGDIERMKKEAQQFSESDKKKQDFIRCQEKARKLLTTTEGAIKAFDSSVANTLKSDINAVQLQMSELQKIINNATSIQVIEEKLKALESLANKMLTTSYNMSVKK